MMNMFYSIVALSRYNLFWYKMLNGLRRPIRLIVSFCVAPAEMSWDSRGKYISPRPPISYTHAAGAGPWVVPLPFAAGGLRQRGFAALRSTASLSFPAPLPAAEESSHIRSAAHTALFCRAAMFTAVSHIHHYTLPLARTVQRRRSLTESPIVNSSGKTI